MATVYLAQDVRHDRAVALKVLRPELAAVIGAERFLAEIKLTANLQHPHILPLFDSGEADSYLFYVMPFVQGETLRDRLTREKQLPVADAVRIATEVASALDYAHRHGVVHRDIKPENILIHDGQALVADFGIALAASKAGGARMTETGMSLGTPHYMSPEQAMGEREITARSDVYALGAVLYEMLTGEPPFTGATAQAVVARVLTEHPRPMAVQRHTIPRNLEAAVLTALEKLPADRFATAAEFADALKDKTYASTVSMRGRTRGHGAREGPRARPASLSLLGAVAAVATIAALWGWLRPAPAQPLTQFSLALPASQALQPPREYRRRAARHLARRPPRSCIPARAREAPGSGCASSTSSTPRRSRAPRAPPAPSSHPTAAGSASSRAATTCGSPRSRGRRRSRSPTRPTRRPATGDPTATSTSRWTRGWPGCKPTGGVVEPVYTFAASENVVGTEWPDVLPGARGLIFRLRHAGQGAADCEIMAMPLPNGNRHVLTRGIYAHYAPDRPPAGGHLRRQAHRHPLRPEEAGAHRVARRADRGGRRAHRRVQRRPGLSANGTLALHHGRRPRVPPRRLGQPGGHRVAGGRVVGSAGHHRSASRSRPTARRSRSDSSGTGGGTSGSSSFPPDRSPGSPSATPPAVRPAWSPDGRDVLYFSDRAGSGVGPPTATGPTAPATPALLTSSRLDFGQIVRLARRALADPPTVHAAAGNGDIFGQRSGDTALVPLVASSATELYPSLSPDGSWLAYASNESGTFEVYVRPFPETAAAKWQVSTAGGTEPIWAEQRPRAVLHQRQERDGVGRCPDRAPRFTVGEQRTLFSIAQFAQPGPVPSYSREPRRQAVPDDARGRGGAAERADRGGELDAAAGGARALTVAFRRVGRAVGACLVGRRSPSLVSARRVGAAIPEPTRRRLRPGEEVGTRPPA